MPTPSEIQTCIDNLTTSNQPIDFTLLAAETSNANTGISFSVATVDDLPDLETTPIGEGQVVFVESIGVPVISTLNAWTGLDGRLLRRDYNTVSLFSWGSNNCGALGYNTVGGYKTTPVKEACNFKDWTFVSTGLNVSGIRKDGSLWTWGQGSCGDLGDGTTVSKCLPSREITSSTNWCYVSKGGGSARSTLAIKTDGTMWGWGVNYCGILAFNINGSTLCSPIQESSSSTNWCQVDIGGKQSSAVKADGSLWGWGGNYFGSLGTGTRNTITSPGREVTSSLNWCQVSTGDSTAAVKTDGTLWAWGRNQCGQLGNGTTVNRCSPVRESCSSTDWCQVSMSPCSFYANSASAIKTSGELWSWGQGTGGKLGDGSTNPSCSPVREFCSATDWCKVITTLCSGSAIKTTGQIWSWGINQCGVLGIGGGNSCSPVREFSSSSNWIFLGTAAQDIVSAICVNN